jgi:hypothetical protein
MKLLSSFEIMDRLIRFNETNDWSVFNDVPPEQHVSIMYPHMLKEVLEKVKAEHEQKRRTMNLQS